MDLRDYITTLFKRGDNMDKEIKELREQIDLLDAKIKMLQEPRKTVRQRRKEEGE